MKKSILRALSFVLLAILVIPFASCDSRTDDTADTTTAQADTTTARSDTTTIPGGNDGDASDTTLPQSSDTTPELPSDTTVPGTGTTDEAEYPWSETPATLRVLAIGNSFSTDAMQYLYDIAKSAGVKEIVLGNLYIGGCTLATHLEHAQRDDGAYTYYKNTSGKWISTANTKFSAGLADEKWDIITMQQSSKVSGINSSYGTILTNLIKIVNEKKTNPDARLLWHMTWAYQQDSTHSSFPNYDRDQMKMYNMIIDAVKNEVMDRKEISGLIPTGTSVQNARTSFAGDHLTRDGYHMNYTLGRYIAGLTFYAGLTGADISNIAFLPSADITPEVMAMAKDAVKDAMKTPYAVTESTHKTGTWSGAAPDAGNKEIVLPADCFESDLGLAATVGVDLTKYRLLEYEYIENSYYYCTKGTSLTTPGASGSTYHQNICSKKIYSKSEIPENSIIICDSGWQYRPELWVSLDKKAETRPGMVTNVVKKLDADFWGSNNYFAFNIAASPKTDISTYYDAAASHIRIYVPVS